MIFQRRNAIASTMSGLLMLVAFIAGFGVPNAVTGNLDGLQSRIRRLPQTLTGQGIGNFEEDEFERAYKRAVAYVGNRRVVTLLFYKDYTSIIVEKPDKENAYDKAILRGGHISTRDYPYDLVSQSRLFTVDETPIAVVKKALGNAAKDNNLKRLMYISLGKDIRLGSTAENGSLDRSAYIDIMFVFKDGSDVLHYDGKTGEKIP